MTRRLVTTALVMLAAVGSGCGGDSDSGSESMLSVDEYRSELDAACTSLFAGLDDLTAEAGEQGLEPSEIEERADELTSEFEAAAAELEPPAALADAHAEMIALGDDVPAASAGLEAFLDYERQNLEAFEALGAEECIAGEQAAIEQLEGAG